MEVASCELRVAREIRFARNSQIVTRKSFTAESDPETPSPEKTLTLHNVVLSDLIMTLMQKKVLTATEGKDLLRKLFVQ